MALFTSHPDRSIFHGRNLVNSWSVVMPRGAGKGDKFLDGVERAITTLEIANLTIERKELFARNMDNGEDKLSRVSLRLHCGDANPYITHFSVQDFGKHLILSQLVEDEAMASAQKRSMFETEAAQSYFTLVKVARDAALKELADELKQDVSKLNAHSKGIIDIV